MSLVRRHQLAGWWGLVAFASVGIALEAMHGFKIGWYLDLANETRRHLFTLAHAHGTVLSLVNLAFAASPPASSVWASSSASSRPGSTAASACLLAATILLPGGFFLGGLAPSGGDPGIGIVAVPIGAAALVAGAVLTAWAITRDGARSR